MSTEDKGQDPILDQAISEIRNEAVDPATVRAAADRVWARLARETAETEAEVEAIRSCGDYRALFPAYREGRLSPARALLVEDHTHECPACRKLLAGAAQPVIAFRKPHIRPVVWQWAAAAALLVAAVLTGRTLFDRYAVPSGPPAAVASLEGTLYRVDGGRTVAVRAGAPLAELENVRTAMGSHAVVRLRDGSLVEMRERTQLGVSERRSGATIRLAAGSVIVQAAKQHSRHLYVETEDCLVSVTGTIFSVNHGIKGSRVSVVEGEVKVTQGADTKVLYPGDQTATSASLTAVPVRDEIAWSDNADRYVAVLGELTKFRKRLEALPGQGLRYSTRLLDLVPDGTVFYAAVPNIGPTLGEASRIFHEQLQQSAPLREWWAEKMKSGDSEAKLDEVLGRLQAFGQYLGPEVVITFAPEVAPNAEAPVAMAEVTRPGLRDFMEQQVKGQPIRVIDDPSQAVASAGVELYVYVGPDLVVAARQLPQLQAVLAAQAGRSAFPKSAFHARLAQSYVSGVSWLFAADLQAVVGKSAGVPAASGFSDAQYLVVERKDVSGQTENHAVLTFAKTRSGVASWLAAPAPIRALDYVSSGATFAAAAVVKSPSALLDDAVAMAGDAKGLAEFEATTGVNLRDDLARSLGGEFAFAVDGPLLPMPSWKLVLEVYDPARFQATLDKLVSTANQFAPQIKIAREDAGGRTYYTLSGAKAGFEAQYVYDSGFLIAAPNRDLLLRAMEYRATGNMLAHSAQFTALLPHDGHTDFSAVVYHSLGTALAPLSGNIVLSPEQQKSLASVAAAAGPTVVLMYGEQDRIELASAGTFFGLRLEQFLGGFGLPAHHGRPKS